METQVPESFDGIDAEALDKIEAELTAEFDRKYDGDTPAPVADLAEIAAALDAVRAAQKEIVAEAKKDEADRQALAERVRTGTQDVVEDDPDAEALAEAPTAEADAADAESETEVAETPELVTASTPPAKAKAPSARRLATRSVEAPPRDGADLVITASADVPGYANGQTLDRVGVAKAMHARARGLGDSRGKRSRFNVATVASPVPAEFVIPESGGDAHAIIEDAVRSTLAGKDAAALVASGGWCPPSENLFDQFSVESRDGLLDLPTVGVTRGGTNVPSYFGLSDVAGALWSWTEADDETAGAPFAITDMDTTSGTTTATATDHGLATGQTVSIVNASVSALNGTYAVTVTGDDTFTFVSGAADGTNATGEGQLQKGCLTIPCPTWTDTRLEAEGICLSHGNLMDRAYPELTARFVDLAMTAHLHRLSNAKVAKIIASATAVTVTSAPSDMAGDVLNAIDLQVADYRSQHLMGANVVLDAIFPQWFVEAIRSTLAMRNGVDSTNVSNAEIVAHFTTRNVRPQFLAGYRPLYGGSAATGWPATSKFLLMAAGSYVAGDGGGIDLGVVRDSVLNSTNDFTAAWSEQFYSVIKRGPAAREVTVTTVVNGQTGGLEFAGA